MQKKPIKQEPSLNSLTVAYQLQQSPELTYCKHSYFAQHVQNPLPSDRQHLCWCLSGGKRGDYQNCYVLYCVLKLCTVKNTFRWAVLTVLWIGFCLTWPILLCIDLFVFAFVFCMFCFTLHSCCIIVSMVGWTRWDWSLILWTRLPSVLWHC